MVNQSPPYGGVNLFEVDPLVNAAAAGFPDSVRQELSELGAFWGTHEAREFARLANHYTPELERYNARGERIDQVSFHPAYHALMRRSVLAGLHCSSFDRGEDEAGLRHRARAVRFYMTAQTGMRAPLPHDDDERFAGAAEACGGAARHLGAARPLPHLRPEFSPRRRRSAASRSAWA